EQAGDVRPKLWKPAGSSHEGSDIYATYLNRGFREIARRNLCSLYEPGIGELRAQQLTPNLFVFLAKNIGVDLRAAMEAVQHRENVFDHSDLIFCYDDVTIQPQIAHDVDTRFGTARRK